MKKLDIISLIFDTCLLFNKNISAIIDLQIDDSLIASITKFMKIESRELDIVELVIKLCEGLIMNYSLDFNGFIITIDNNGNMIIN